MTSTSQPSDQHENLYFIDHESGAEMARLLEQDRVLTKAMGGLWSERSNDFSGIHRVLDLGCGPGGWVQEIAFANPEVEAVGVDISEQMIAYAQMQARLQNLTNASFRVMDIQRPLDFPDASFDLVNARLIAFLPPGAWPSLLSECVRISRPGGILRLTETEGAFGTSAAMEKLMSLFHQAMYRTGQSFSPGGRVLGITPVLAHLLRESGWQHVQIRAHGVDFSVGTEAYESIYHNLEVFLKLMQPFLVQVGVTTQEEADRTYKQMLVEMRSPDFCGLMYLLSVWGQRP